MALRYNFFPVGDFKFCYIGNPFFIRFSCIEISFELIFGSRLRFGKMIFFLLFPNNRMYPQFLHNPMDPVLAIVRMVEMVYPTCHSPVA